MEESILNSIKKLLGLEADYAAFDQDILMHINSTFSVLEQIGATPPGGIFITGPSETWAQYFQGLTSVHMVKSYIYVKVRQLFDPPSTSFALDALKNQATEYEWRLGIMEFAFNPRPIVESDSDA